MEKTIIILQKYATGRVVAVLFAFTIAIYCTMPFYSIPSVIELAPHMKLFDMSPTGYSSEYAFALLNAIGPNGRYLYLSVQLPLDFVYPGLFAITFFLLLIWLFAKSFNSRSKIYYFVFVPIIAGIFDYIENIGIIVMLDSFPHISTQVVEITSAFSILKSVFTVVFYGLLVIGLVSFARNRIRKPKS